MSDTNFLRQLEGGNSLARRNEQVHRVNPLVKRDMGSLEDSASSDSEILMAVVAAIESRLARSDSIFAAGANGALDPIWPKPRFKIGSRRFFVGKHLEQLKGADRDVIVYV